jgi:hypothetical protein
MPEYQLEWQDSDEGWRLIRSIRGQDAPEAFQRFNDQEELEPGEYRLRADPDADWEYVTLTEDGAEIYTP